MSDQAVLEAATYTTLQTHGRNNQALREIRTRDPIKVFVAV